jgi:single-stranded-DNA-specific exonuclease
MQKIWKIKKPDIDLQKSLSRDLSVSPLLAQLLINRNITSAQDGRTFLVSDISNLHNAALLPDIDRAYARVQKALERNEKVLLFADYDADGITALALMKSAFDRLGLAHTHYLPHRLKEGYGLSAQSVKYAIDNGFHLVITLDCGISNFREIDQLQKSNIDVIVIDHHNLISDKAPPAHAVINPKRRDCEYPYPELAGVGIAYKFSGYLLDCLLEDTLDLVCVGTIADVAPLLGENRILVKEGIKQLNATRRPGLRSLIEISGIKKKTIDTQSISYILGPRINACGRIDSSEAALGLLLSNHEDEALILAKELHSKNQERSRIEARILDEAISRIETEVDFSRERVIVLHQEGWHQGVLGIVAARLSERYHRPAIVISFIDGIGKGSGRSIENFHLLEGLRECNSYLQEFGGHRRACGLSILRKDIEDFRKEINRIALERLSHQDLLPSLEIEAQLGLSALSQNLLDEIKLCEPFGQGNPCPLFCSYNLQIKSKPVILGRDTLKFWVTDGRVSYPAVGFGMGGYFDLVNSAEALDIAYCLSLDNWKGNNQLQLEIEDIRPC